MIPLAKFLKLKINLEIRGKRFVLGVVGGKNHEERNILGN